ncbi:condensation domain-containing protein, partial [Blautia producta]|nr:condensation domain-containing protein [Blautia producta]
RSFAVSNRMNRMIAGFCREKKVSPFALFYMALAIYLRRIKGQERFCIGVPTINRLNFKEKQMAGMFVILCPLSMSWMHPFPFRNLMKSCRQTGTSFSITR